MDPFVKKLSEYGLEVRSAGVNRGILNTVEQEIKDIYWDNEVEETVIELIETKIFILIKNRELFLRKIRMEKEAKRFPLFVTENLQLNVLDDPEMVPLELDLYDINEHSEEKIIKHVEENLSFYEEYDLEWKMKRVFNKTEADSDLCEVLREKQIEFKEMVDEEDALSKLYNELIEATEEILMPKQII